MKIKYMSIIWVNEEIKEHYQSWAAIQNLSPYLEVGREYDCKYLIELVGWKYTQKEEGIFFDYWIHRKKLLLKNILEYKEINDDNKIIKILNPSKLKIQLLKINKIDPYNYLNFDVPNKNTIKKELKKLGIKKGDINDSSLNAGQYIIIIDKLLVYFMWDKKYKISINLQKYITKIFNKEYKNVKLDGIDYNFLNTKPLENLKEICIQLIQFYYE